MIIYVIETSDGIVKSVANFPIVPGFDAYLAAENYAKKLCKENGIVFEGSISCDHSITNYSIQVLEQK